MRPVSEKDVLLLGSHAYQPYVRHFLDAGAKMHAAMRRFGLRKSHDAGAAARCEALRRRLVKAGARMRNDGKSVVYGPLSPACARCRTGVRSVSEFISLACARSCYFCFNSNQCDYDLYRTDRKDWKSELETFSQQMGRLDFVALTGGEPMLFHDEALEFFSTVNVLAPGCHTRLYTSGDKVDEAVLRELADVGLDEIRFSVKLEESQEGIEDTMRLIEAAVGVIPAVMVEMPVIPGTHEHMTWLLDRLEEAGVFGVNLLEFCFPLHNAEEYRRRGFELVGEPYRIPYDYGYAGALPVAGSEELALRLMEERIERGTRLGLHYCSLENKNTAQIYEQNGGGALDIPGYRFSRRSFFYEVVRAFGADARVLAAFLEESGIAYFFDEEGDMVMFDPSVLESIADVARSSVIYLSSAVIEDDGAGRKRFREVGLQVVEPRDFTMLAHDGEIEIEGE